MPFILALPADNRRQMVRPEHREIEDSRYNAQTESAQYSACPSETEPAINFYIRGPNKMRSGHRENGRERGANRAGLKNS